MPGLDFVLHVIGLIRPLTKEPILPNIKTALNSLLLISALSLHAHGVVPSTEAGDNKHDNEISSLKLVTYNVDLSLCSQARKILLKTSSGIGLSQRDLKPVKIGAYTVELGLISIKPSITCNITMQDSELLSTFSSPHISDRATDTDIKVIALKNGFQTQIIKVISTPDLMKSHPLRSFEWALPASISVRGLKTK